MKYRKTFRCMSICLLLAIKANTQQTKPAIPTMFSQPVSFNQLPQKIVCNIASLEKLFNASGTVSFQLSSAHILEGKVISHVKPNAIAETINIRFEDFHGAIFTLSRVRTENGSMQYTGHILNFQDRDAMVLQADNGKYYFSKTEQRLILTE